MGEEQEQEQEQDQEHEQDKDQDVNQDAISASAPVSQSSSSVNGATSFVVPHREILTKDDLELFHGSETYASLFEFLDKLNESVVGVVSTAECPQSEVRICHCRDHGNTKCMNGG